MFQSAAGDPNFIAVAVGSFADPAFPPPTESSYDHRRHHWVELPATIHAERPELWDEVKPLYDAGRYAEAADRGREILAEHPRQGRLTYNLACVESLAGRTDDAVGHLREAIDMWEGCRDMAKGDPDFDPIREDPGFVELIEA